MAKVTKVTGPAMYHLVLSEFEAKALYAAISHVGGDPRTTGRKYTQDIRDALGEVVGYYDWESWASGSTIMTKESA